MSTDMLKLIPADPQYIPTPGTHAKAVERLQALLPEGREFEAESFDKVTFIDAGENTESVVCPACKRKSELSSDNTAKWWHSLMDDLEQNAWGPEGLKTAMPCCNRQVDVMTLSFDWPAGFARFEINISDPNIARNLTTEELRDIEAILGCKLQQVRAHY